MMRTFALMALLALAVAGCGAQPGRAIVTYDTTNPTVFKLADVTKQGLYVLFPGNGVAPMDGGAVYLHPGDKFGFKTVEGKVVGTYISNGQQTTIPLDGVLTEEYVWKYQGDKQP
jgi:hypothetical protein